MHIHNTHVAEYYVFVIMVSMSIKELKIAQQAHEEALRQEAEQEESQKAQEAQQKDKARQDYEPMMELLAEQESLRQEVKRMEAEKVQERAKETKLLKETEYQKNQELENSKAELDNLEEELRQVQEMVAGKKENEIADPVKEAIQELAKQILEAKAKHLEISSVLEGVRSGQISDEELAKYSETKDKIAEIEAKILEIESNPEIVEMVMAEARSEWEQRKKVSHEVVRYMGAYGKEDQKNILEELTEVFIDEEIKASGINEIKNTDERIKATKDFIDHLGVGIQFKSGEIKADNEYQATALRAARGLKSLLDGSIWTENALNALTSEIPNSRVYESMNDFRKDTAGQRQRTNVAVERHLGTINLMRAYNQGMKEYRNDVAPGSARGGDRIDKLGAEISQKGDFMAGREGPILPKNVTAEQKKVIEETFLKNKNKAEYLERKLRSDEIQQLTGEIERTGQELTDIQTGVQEAVEAEKIVEREEGYGRTKPKFDEQIGAIEKNTVDVKNDLQKSKENLANLWFFSFGKKKELNFRIQNDESAILLSETNLAKLEQRKDAYENASKILSRSLGRESGYGGRSYEKFASSLNLMQEKAKIENWIKDKKERLNKLESLKTQGEQK